MSGNSSLDAKRRRFVHGHVSLSVTQKTQKNIRMTKRDLRTAQYIAAKWDTRKITFNSLKNKEAELLFAFWSGELQKRIDTAEQEILEDIFLAAKDFDSAEYLAYLWDTRVITFNTLTHREAELLCALWSGDLRKRVDDTEQAVHRELHIAR